MPTKQTPPLAYARLAALKGAVKLEGLGMKHSSGRSMRRQAASELGLKANATTDDVIGVLNREMERLLNEEKLWQARHQKATRYMVEEANDRTWTLVVYDGNGTLLSVTAGSTRDQVLQ